jgi:hypothetical protein
MPRTTAWEERNDDSQGSRPRRTATSLGDEIWRAPLLDAIRAEAEIITADAGSDLLEASDRTGREALRDRVIAKMTAALIQLGDTYQAPDGVIFSLADEPGVDLTPHEDNLGPVSLPTPGPIVEEVLRFERLPLGSPGTRRAVVHWSDGTESEALRWYADEILICEAT